ncbi:peptidase domain-containing ABC transporter [Microtetraspora fusca]|uniref:Peptidase domain-containing ABC transporter n=1 Tax=Microtetraspora fusca TaxID=1997 RepID=A0ABW6VHB8_MICFU|nr:peptidase domain-containing ABC transporter [Microtetraspora fusca]
MNRIRAALMAVLALVRRRTRRVPLRQQLTATECGIACLAMIAGYFGRHTMMAECRAFLSAGRDGLSVGRLMDAAARLGLAADVEQVAPADLPDGPLMLFWRGRHFVVLERRTRRWVRIADPSGGRRRLTHAEFAEEYSGICLTLRPEPDFRPRLGRARDWPIPRYLREVLAVPGTRTPMAGILLASAALQGVGLALPLATAYVVDTLLPQRQAGLVPLLALGVAVTAMTHAGAALMRGWVAITLRTRANAVLTRGFMAHLLRLPLLFFLQRSRGDLLMRLASVMSAREVLTGQLFMIVLDASMLSFYLVGLAVMAPAYLALTLLLGLVQVGLIAVTYGRQGRLAKRELYAMSEEQGYLVETLDAVLPLKANGAEARALRHWGALFERHQDASLRRGRSSAVVEAALSTMRVLSPLAMLVLGVSLVLDGTMTAGAMLAANAVAVSVLTPLGSLATAGQSLQSVRAQVERMHDVLDSGQERVGPTGLPGGGPIGVELSRATFGYDPEAAPVLQDISLTMRPGCKIGVAGRTGSGKSTLALMVLGLLRPDSGEIRLSGVPLEELDLHELRASCGAVLQHLSLFDGTIADNITMGSPDASQADVEYAADVAGLHDDVQRMPMRYATRVGEGGMALSAGQRQRVALARALVHRPRLLILDEATSHLDPATERRVDAALNRLRVTRLVISHRLSAIENADEIVVLDAGRIAERGTHAELLELGGHYAAMFGPLTSGETATAAERLPGLVRK